MPCTILSRKSRSTIGTKLDVGKALKAALEANQEALAGDNRPSGLISLPLLNEYYLGQLFYFLMLSIGYEGELANVDAYDQPGWKCIRN